MDATWPALEGAPGELERAARERERCARLILDWNGPSGLDKEVAAAVRSRARALLETKTDAAYWCNRRWRQDVFGWSSALWKGARWEPESSVSIVVEVQRAQATLWGLAAWAEGREVADWVDTCARMWAIELGRVADEARRRGTTLGMPAVEGLWKLADELRQHGELQAAGILDAIGLLLGAGYEETLAGVLQEMAGGVAAERLCQHLDPGEDLPS